MKDEKYSQYQNVVEVHPEKCTGCTYCEKDCPYAAIEMVPRPPGEKYKQIAVVIDRRCAECGICVGACPFGAIEFPFLTDQTMAQRVGKAAGAEDPTADPSKRLVLFLCEWSVEAKSLVGSDSRLVDLPQVHVVMVPCTGMIKPEWVELAFAKKTGGVVVCGCPLGDCHYREGNQFCHDRLLAIRMPRVKRAKIAADRLGLAWLAMEEREALLGKLREFANRLGLSASADRLRGADAPR